MSKILLGAMVAAVILAPTQGLAQVTATVEVMKPDVPPSAKVGESVTIGGFASVAITNSSNRLAIVSFSVSITDSTGKLNLAKSSAVCLVNPNGKKRFHVNGPRQLSYDHPGTVTVTCAASVSGDGIKKSNSLSTSFKVASQ